MAATTEPVSAIRQLSCQVNGEQIQLDLPDERRTHAARRAARLSRHHVAQERLPATGPMRLLHRAHGRQAGAVVCAVAGEGRRQIDHDARRTRRGASPADRRIRSSAAAACSAASASRAWRCAASGCATRTPNRAARKSPARSSHTCAAAPVTRRSSTASSCTASCAAANRCPSRRPPTNRAASAPTCRATPATTPCSATASSSTT